MRQLNINIENVWRDLASRYSKKEQVIIRLFKELVGHYSEAHRYYHNLNHLVYLIDHFYRYESALNEPDTVLFSIFYHDVIYNPIKRDNEIQSAELAQRALMHLKVPSKKADDVATYILATADHKITSGADTDLKFFMDFDLAILASSPEVYRAYLFNIQKEYGSLPVEQFIAGRKAFIKNMLNQSLIFYTNSFQGREEVARKNMQWELEIGLSLFSAR